MVNETAVFGAAMGDVSVSKISVAPAETAATLAAIFVGFVRACATAIAEK